MFPSLERSIRMRVIFASQRIEFTSGHRIDAAKCDADKIIAEAQANKE
jgi:hypothetical protein